jgi:hypothetical protein
MRLFYLQGVQIPVDAVFNGDQFIMRSLFYNAAIFEHADAIGMLDGA